MVPVGHSPMPSEKNAISTVRKTGAGGGRFYFMTPLRSKGIVAANARGDQGIAERRARLGPSSSGSSLDDCVQTHRFGGFRPEGGKRKLIAQA